MSIEFKNAKQRSVAPFRADIVGSFLRPEVIKEARAKFQNQEISSNELKRIEDEEIIKLVKNKRNLGLKQ